MVSKPKRWVQVWESSFHSSRLSGLMKLISLKIWKCQNMLKVNSSHLLCISTILLLLLSPILYTCWPGMKPLSEEGHFGLRLIQIMGAVWSKCRSARAAVSKIVWRQNHVPSTMRVIAELWPGLLFHSALHSFTMSFNYEVKSVNGLQVTHCRQQRTERRGHIPQRNSGFFRDE